MLQLKFPNSQKDISWEKNPVYVYILARKPLVISVSACW